MYHSAMDNGWMNRARARMRENKISQDQLALSLGCTRGAISHYLSGRRIPNLDQLDAIASCLNVHPAWLLYGDRANGIRDNAASYGNEIPVTGDTQSGPTDTIRGYLPLPGFSSGCYALQVRGTRYSPRMYEGEAILLDPGQEVEPGDDVLIKMNKEGAAGVYGFVNSRDGRLTVNQLLDNRLRYVMVKDDLELIHCIIAVVRANSV